MHRHAHFRRLHHMTANNINFNCVAQDCRSLQLLLLKLSFTHMPREGWTPHHSFTRINAIAVATGVLPETARSLGRNREFQCQSSSPEEPLTSPAYFAATYRSFLSFSLPFGDETATTCAKLHFCVHISEHGQLFEPVLANNATPRRILHGALKTTQSMI